MRDHTVKPTKKNAALRASDDLTAETLRTLCRESVFPKRSRWLIAQPIADLINEFHSHVMIANEIKVETYGLMVERYEHQTLAIAYLEAANIKMSLALTVLDLDADRLEKWAEKFNIARKEVMSWKAGDRRRYEKKYGPISPETIREQSWKKTKSLRNEVEQFESRIQDCHCSSGTQDEPRTDAICHRLADRKRLHAYL